MKKESKIRYIILIIAVITGFTYMFTTAVQGKSERLAFEAEAVGYPIILEEWVDWEEEVHHLRILRINDLTGYINGIWFDGINVINSHVKIDLITGELIANGKVTWYITWDGEGGKTGTFYGPVNTKGVYGGVLNSKITLQGAGDFDGWKLFGEVWNINVITNGLSGTILIPN
ncbi:MAG: hypothetical protein ACW96S_10950 [Promethearchaeota archaeon]|jgi:hypothetical protein